jgi:hypothetical protein
MFAYIAAVATAVTLIVCSPVASAATESGRPKVVKAENVAPAPVRLINDRFPTSIVLDAVKPYFLSKVEQKALSRALFRSVRFLDSAA